MSKKQKRCKCGSKKMYKNCCGKGKKRTIKSIGQFEKDPADITSCSIATIAEVRMVVIDEEMKLPMLIPHDDWEDHLDFDRNAVKLGFSEFVRPVMKSDGPEYFDHQKMDSHVIVRGDEQFRVRLSIDLTLDEMQALIEGFGDRVEK